MRLQLWALKACSVRRSCSGNKHHTCTPADDEKWLTYLSDMTSSSVIMTSHPPAVCVPAVRPAWGAGMPLVRRRMMWRWAPAVTTWCPCSPPGQDVTYWANWENQNWTWMFSDWNRLHFYWKRDDVTTDQTEHLYLQTGAKYKDVFVCKSTINRQLFNRLHIIVKWFV